MGKIGKIARLWGGDWRSLGKDVKFFCTEGLYFDVKIVLAEVLLCIEIKKKGRR